MDERADGWTPAALNPSLLLWTCLVPLNFGPDRTTATRILSAFV